jgi:hypothetical protein
VAKFYTPRELEQAADLYNSFRETDARKINTVKLRMPGIVVAIGHLEYIGYRTSHQSETTFYKHPFRAGSRPLLASSPDGKQLFLLGGRYDFTGRGIVDRDAHGRPVFDPDHGEDDT